MEGPPEIAVRVIAAHSAPRSTPDRAVFAGRALVDPDGCYTLKAEFPEYTGEVALIFPEECRAEKGRSFSLGVISFVALMLFSTIAGQACRFLLRRQNRIEDDAKDT